MDRQHILKLAENIVSNLALVEENIYKGTLNINEKVAGVYYFDLNNTAFEDFEAYQERILANEFYANPGNMQWNYYLFLLNDQIDLKQKIRIEKNDKYARKYVLDETEFADFFTVEKSAAKIQPNIVMEWKASLTEADLQEVYTEATYVEVFERFKNDQTKKDPPTVLKKQTNNIINIKYIDRLILKDSYRAHPLGDRDFKFGQVNLFKGINGVGKTSLFEAIESMICGRCLRNADQAIPNGCIEAEFNHSGKLANYESDNPKLYQARDFHWYSSNYSRGNFLFNSFNQFNFFNADAAHRFSTGNSEEEIRDALFNIILGPEYTFITERCEKMLERIRPEYNRLTDSLAEARKAINAADKIIDNHKETDALLFIRQEVAANISALKFKYKSDDPNQHDIEAETLNNQLQSVLDNFKRSEYIFRSQNHFNDQLSEFDRKKAAFKALEKNIRELSEQLTLNAREQKEALARVAHIEKCLEYLNDDKLMSLQGLALKIKEISFTKSKIEYVKKLIVELNLTEFKSTLDIKSLIQANLLSIDELNKKVLAAEQSIQVYLDQFSKIEGLIKEIKSFGKAFLEQDFIASDCPLCQSNFDRDELEARILAVRESKVVFQENDLDINRQQIRENQEEIQRLEKRNLHLQNILSAYLSYNDTVPAQLSLDQTVHILKEFLSQESLINDQLQELNNIVSYADSLGKSENEFNSLKARVEQLDIELPTFDVGHKEDFILLSSKAVGQLESIKENFEKINKERITSGAALKKLLDMPTEQIHLKDAIDIINLEEEKFSRFGAYFKSLTQLIEIMPQELIIDIESRSDIFSKNLDSLKAELKSLFEYNNAIEIKKKNSSFLDKNKDKHKRFEKALSTLKNLTGTNASDHVNTFFNDNFAEIVDVFKTIHVPREFSDIKYENNRLRLITESGEVRTVTQISTGQRSALALAIFLSLNRKLANGPNIIMFDDPVAFIDDLNALSFLDYLRMYILSSGRQIFFATANMRLASLFEKKFAFLDQEFKHWELSR